MFTVKHDVVFDPFAGTGTTLLAALAAERNSIGIEIDPSLAASSLRMLLAGSDVANAYTDARLLRHIEFAAKRSAENKPVKYVNMHYGFPVMTRQEQELLLNEVVEITAAGENRLCVTYSDKPQQEISREWTSEELESAAKGITNGIALKHHNPKSISDIQEQLRF
jgi:hypothetical protein